MASSLANSRISLRIVWRSTALPESARGDEGEMAAVLAHMRDEDLHRALDDPLRRGPPSRASRSIARKVRTDSSTNARASSSMLAKWR